MYHTIQVNQRHIDMGKRHECSRCPVALAIAERFGLPAERVAVKPLFIDVLWDEADRWRFVDAPLSVSAFVRGYDNGVRVAPFAFQLPAHASQWEPTYKQGF